MALTRVKRKKYASSVAAEFKESSRALSATNKILYCKSQKCFSNHFGILLFVFIGIRLATCEIVANGQTLRYQEKPNIKRPSGKKGRNNVQTHAVASS